jgi:hypothetical protein
MRRALVAALVPVLLLPLAASADIGIRSIDAQTARTGDRVRITARGFLGARPWPAMPVEIVAAAQAPRPSRLGVTPRMRAERLRRPPYHLVGSIRGWRRLANGHGVGTLEFRVPAVIPDRYVLGLFCDRCVRGPKGSLIIDRRLVMRVK